MLKKEGYSHAEAVGFFAAKIIGILFILTVGLYFFIRGEVVEPDNIGSVFLHDESETPKVGYFQLGVSGLDDDYVRNFEASVRDKLGRSVKVDEIGVKESKFYNTKTTFFQTDDYLVDDDTYYRLTARASEKEGVFYVEHKYYFDAEIKCLSTTSELKSSLAKEYGITDWRPADDKNEFNTGLKEQLFSDIDDVYTLTMGWSCEDKTKYTSNERKVYVRVGMPPSLYRENNTRTSKDAVMATILAHKD